MITKAEQVERQRTRLLEGTGTAHMTAANCNLAAALRQWLPNYKGSFGVLATSVHNGLKARGYKIVGKQLVDNSENGK
jgi:hypothetical protein